MEKVYQLIENAILIAKILRAEGRIGCITYDTLRDNIRQIDVEFASTPSRKTLRECLSATRRSL